MRNLVENIKPQTPSEWVMAIGVLGALSMFTMEVAVGATRELTGIPKPVAEDVITLFYYAFQFFHGILTAGLTSKIFMRIGRNSLAFFKSIKEI